MINPSGILFFIAYAVTTLTCEIATAQVDVSATETLIKRVVPAYATHFKIESLPLSTAKDEFEIESAKNNTIILRGNNGVAVASALYYYLTEYAHCQITWNGTNLNLPKVLPKNSLEGAEDNTVSVSLLLKLLHL